jgi:hypothetical protein
MVVPNKAITNNEETKKQFVQVFIFFSFMVGRFGMPG